MGWGTQSFRAFLWNLGPSPFQPVSVFTNQKALLFLSAEFFLGFHYVRVIKPSNSITSALLPYRSRG